MQSHKHIGKTALTVAPISFGSAPIANLYTEIPEKQAIETIQYVLEAGINFIDTAPHYGAGMAEDRIGTALLGVNRQDYVIETKVGLLLTPDGERIYDYSADGVLRSLEASLKRMNLDYVDSLLIHDFDTFYDSPAYVLKETYPALAKLRDQGVVKAIGIGANQWEVLEDYARGADFDCFLLAGRYTLLEQKSLEAMNRFHKQGISILGAGVYNTGILASGTKHKGPLHFQYRDASPEIVAQVKQIEEVCAEYDIPLPAAALQFVAAHPAVVSLVVGMESVLQIQATKAWFDIPIPNDFWLALRENKLIHSDSPLPLDSHLT